MLKRKNTSPQGAAQGNGFASASPKLEGYAKCKEYYETLKDTKLIRTRAHEVCARQHLKITEKDLDKLVPLIDDLYTIPDPVRISEKAKAAGIVLEPLEVNKMFWIIQAFQEAVNEKKRDAQ